MRLLPRLLILFTWGLPLLVLALPITDPSLLASRLSEKYIAFPSLSTLLRAFVGGGFDTPVNPWARMHASPEEQMADCLLLTGAFPQTAIVKVDGSGRDVSGELEGGQGRGEKRTRRICGEVQGTRDGVGEGVPLKSLRR